jgi:peptidoglycan-associated lipoprotein
MNRKILMTVLMTAAVGLGGCATTDDGLSPEERAAGAEAAGAAGRLGARGRALLAKRTVYFEFDSSALTGESRDIVEAHAAHLAAGGKTSVTLEGHADERGTREYNLALGERRSQAVERVMRALGVNADRLKTVSYGEERPAVQGHDEAAWSKNRRVEILY